MEWTGAADLIGRAFVPDLAWLLVLARALGLAWTAPGWGAAVPGLGGRFRPVLAGLLAAALAPAIAPSLAPDLAAAGLASVSGPGAGIDWPGVILAMSVEAAVGAGLGFGAALVIAAARQAGEIVGAQAGLSPASLLQADPAGDDSGGATALGHLYGLVALAIFLALDGPIRLVAELAESYQTFPAALAGGVPDAALASLAFAAVGHSLALAVRLAAPAGLALVLAGLALAWIGRATRGASPAQLAWPARSALGVALAWLGLAGLAATLAVEWGG